MLIGDGALGRFGGIVLEEMSSAQRAAYRTLIDGVRGSVPKPYQIWLCNPELVEALESFGLYLLKRSSLTPQEIEIAILVAARHWGARYVAYAHAQIGRRVGLSQPTVEALCDGERPAFDSERERAVHDVAVALHRGGALREEIYARAKGALGDRELSDLAGLLGYYASVAFTLNLYDVPVPVAAKDA